jgi:Cu+-exporting ATPase
MVDDVQHDQFVMIKIEGMHCHRCQQAIKKALAAKSGVHEVEVDFASGQASVLYDPQSVRIRDLVDAVASAGYRATGFTQGTAPGHVGH